MHAIKEKRREKLRHRTIGDPAEIAARRKIIERQYISFKLYSHFIHVHFLMPSKKVNSDEGMKEPTYHVTPSMYYIAMKSKRNTKITRSTREKMGNETTISEEDNTPCTFGGSTKLEG